MYGRSISRTGLAVRSAGTAVRTVRLGFSSVRGLRMFFVVYRKEVGACAVCTGTGTVPYGRRVLISGIYVLNSTVSARGMCCA